jgi:hypothetical protein
LATGCGNLEATIPENCARRSVVLRPRRERIRHSLNAGQSRSKPGRLKRALTLETEGNITMKRTIIIAITLVLASPTVAQEWRLDGSDAVTTSSDDQGHVRGYNSSGEFDLHIDSQGYGGGTTDDGREVYCRPSNEGSSCQ